MARYSASATKTSTAAAGWVFQIRQGASTRDLKLFEIGLFSSSAVAGTYGLVRSSSVGATFTSVLGQAEDPQSTTASGVIDTAASTAPTAASTTNFFRTAIFSAAVGAGVIWTFPTGLLMTAGAGVQIYQSTSSAVGLNIYAAWDE